PSVASAVAVALVWQWIYRPEGGLLNSLLARAHVSPVDWLGDAKAALVALMIVSVWAHVGYQMTVFLVGLEGIPQAYLDAARVGAARRRRGGAVPAARAAGRGGGGGGGGACVGCSCSRSCRSSPPSWWRHSFIWWRRRRAMPRASRQRSGRCRSRASSSTRG